MILALLFVALVFVSGISETNAGVYDPTLEIVVSSGGKVVSNGGMITRGESGSLVFRLSVVRSQGSVSEIKVNDWGIKLSDGLTLCNIVADNDMYRANSCSGVDESLSSKLITLSAQARGDGWLTNSVSFSAKISEAAVSSTPETSLTPTSLVSTPIPAVLTRPQQPESLVGPFDAGMIYLIRKVTAAVAVVSVAVGAVATAGVGGLSAPGATFSLWSLLSFLGWRKRENKWGIVYDSVSKRPLSTAKVEIFSQPDGELRQTRHTNRDGSFGFVIGDGVYSLNFSKKNYFFPSKVVLGSRDGKFGNIYHGEKIDLNGRNGQVVSNNIRMNVPIDLAGLHSERKVVVKSWRFADRFFGIMGTLCLLVGTIVSIYIIAIAENGALSGVIYLAVFVVLWAMKISRYFNFSKLGFTTDGRNEPLEMVTVQVVDKDRNVKGRTLSASDGRFFFDLPPGLYQFNASRTGYDQAISGPILIENSNDLGKVKLVLNKTQLPQG